MDVVRYESYCLAEFLAHAGVLAALNSKYAPRGSAGKFITAYPSDDRRCAAALLIRPDGCIACVRPRDGAPEPGSLSAALRTWFGAPGECGGPDGEVP